MLNESWLIVFINTAAGATFSVKINDPLMVTGEGTENPVSIVCQLESMLAILKTIYEG